MNATPNATPCLYCRDTGMNARTNLECLECDKGRALLRAHLALEARPPCQTDKLVDAWRCVRAVLADMPPHSAETMGRYVALECDLWEADRRLLEAIDTTADLETILWLRRGKEERQRARARALADQPTVALLPQASSGRS